MFWLKSENYNRETSFFRVFHKWKVGIKISVWNLVSQFCIPFFVLKQKTDQIEILVGISQLRYTLSLEGHRVLLRGMWCGGGVPSKALSGTSAFISSWLFVNRRHNSILKNFTLHIIYLGRNYRTNS